MATIGLYYPWIHFRDDDWVKVAMLYWDRLQRIVPSGYPTRDSDTIRAFVDRGWIGNHDAVASREHVAQVFGSVIQEHAASLRREYAIDREDLGWIGHHPGRGVPNLLADRYAFIHVDKVAHPLQEALVTAGLGFPSGRGAQPEWFGVRQGLAAVYMTALAHDISMRGGFFPVTETAGYHVAGAGWSVRQLTEALLPGPASGPSAGAPSEPVAALAFIAMRSVIPKDVSAVPAQRIIDVRERYAAELRSFHESLKAITDDSRLAEISDPDAFQLHLNALYEERLAPRLGELERDLRLLHLDTIPTWLGLRTTLPPAAAWLFADVGLRDPSVAKGGALALAVVGLRASAAADAQAAITSNPAAYLLRVREQLDPPSLRSQITQAIRRLTRGV